MASGATGATFERVGLSDGSRCALKHMSPANDGIMRILRDTGSINALWGAGIFSRLPTPLEPSVLAVGAEADGWAVMMPDVTEHLISPERIVTMEDSHRILAAVNAMHDAFADEHIAGLCSHRDKLELNSPRMVEAERWADADYPPELARDGHEWPFTEAVEHGWDLFTDLAPPEVSSAVASVRKDPDPLARELDRFRSTIIHGDLQFGNIAFTDDAIYLLDWGSAAIEGSPEEDFSWYLMANQPQIDASHETIIEDFQELRGGSFEPEAFDLSTIFIVTVMSVVCPGAMLARLVHVTVVPVRISSAVGANLNCLIPTAADRAASA
jgi:hypothetical protein